jgi:hypothetical protein
MLCENSEPKDGSAAEAPRHMGQLIFLLAEKAKC